MSEFHYMMSKNCHMWSILLLHYVINMLHDDVNQFHDVNLPLLFNKSLLRYVIVSLHCVKNAQPLVRIHVS